MKNLLLVASILLGLSSAAQDKKVKGIDVKVGQKYLVVNTTNTDADLGMGMQMKNTGTIKNTFIVTGETDKELTITNTVSAIKTSIDVMGKAYDYDSEKESDRTSEMGKSFESILGKSQVITFNKYTGISIPGKTDSVKEINVEDKSLKEMMAAFGSNGEEASVAGAFMILPKNKKAGDTWTESDSITSNKSTKTFTLKSIKDNIANVLVSTTVITKNMVNIQGTDMNISLTTNSKGEVIVDTKSSLVLSRIMDSDIAGTMDVMGQSMPVTAKTRLETKNTLVKD